MTLRKVNRLAQGIQSLADHLIVRGQNDGPRTILIRVVKTQDTRGQAVTDLRRNFLIGIVGPFQVLREFPGNPVAAGGTRQNTVPQDRTEFIQVLGDHRIVIGQRELANGTTAPQVQGDAFSVKVLNQSLEGFADFTVIVQHRTGSIEAEDNIARGKAPVVDPAINRVRCNNSQGRCTDTENSQESRDDHPSFTHKRAITRKITNIARVGNPSSPLTGVEL